MTPLEEVLRERIRREGPLSFRDVMQAALYHPEHGYYTNLKSFGAHGDFITCPEEHPAFGWLLGRQALDVWDALDRPRPLRILELGAGSGALAESLVGFLRHERVEFVYSIAEVSPSLKQVQRARLGRDDCLRWTQNDDDDAAAHFLIANEVADALPVHRVIRRGGRLRELCVGLDADDMLTWVESDDAPRQIATYLEALHYTPTEGSLLDLSLELESWVKGVARRLQQGVGLVLDYTASPPRDTLQTYYRHTLGSDPLIRLGRQDISAHVDMRSLVRMAIAEGLRAGATAQRGLLLNLGFQQVVDRLTGPTDRQALAHLVDPEGPGGQIAAVFLLRGMPSEYKPVGAIGGRAWPPPDGVPSLPPDADERDFLSQWREAFPG